MRSASLFACVVLVACARGDTDAPNRASTTTITAASIERVAGPSETDVELTRRVERSLASDRALSLAARNVEVRVTDGVVTLVGSVDDVADRNALTAAVERIPGLSGSLNKVDISASRNEGDRQSDETIAFSIQRALRFDSELAKRAENVTIDVSRGVVTLRGTTSSQTTASDMETLASQTPGVVSVSNQLRTAM